MQAAHDLSHYVTLRIRPDLAGQLEKPLLAKVMRRLHYLPRRNVRIDHPEADEVTSALLKESNFSAQRTLTHMRLDVGPDGGHNVGHDVGHTMA